MLPEQKANFFNNLKHISVKFNEDELNHSDVNSTIKELYNEVRILSKIIPPEGISCDEEEKELVYGVAECVLRTFSVETPIETALLAGTCFVSFVYEVFGLKKSFHCLLNLLGVSSHSQASHAGNTLVEEDGTPRKDDFFNNCKEALRKCVFNDVVVDSCLIEKQMNELRLLLPEYPHLIIVHGILSCRRLDLLTFDIRTDYTVVPFVIFLFSPIFHFCSVPSYSAFHTFQVLLMWIKAVKCVLDEVHCTPTHSENTSLVTEFYFCSKSELVGKMLLILEANWESPVNGVPEAVRNVYAELLEVNLKEQSVLHVEDPLVEELRERTMNLSWEVKGKYIVLSSLLRYINLTEFLEKNPATPSSMLSSIKVNYVASVIGEVYKVIVTRILNEYEMPSEKWKIWWAEPIINSLTCGDKHLLQNVKNYILPWTFKQLPSSYGLLMEEVEAKAGQHDMAVVVLSRMAKEADLVGEKLVLEIAESMLHHNCEYLRMEVFTLLCVSSKKSDAVSSDILSLIKEFLVMNLNIDSSAFDQRIMAQLKTLLIRIRDSTVHEFVNITKKNGDAECTGTVQIMFLEWLVRTALNNVFPGACYQRRRTCLQALNLVFDIFLVAPLNKRRKECPSTSVQSMISWVQQSGYWMFFKDDCLQKIFPCLFDYTDDIRLSAAALLQQFIPWSEDGCEHSICNVDGSVLFKHALELCKDCHIQTTDTGSLISRIVFVKHILEKGMLFAFGNLTFCATEGSKCITAIRFIRKLVDLTRIHLTLMKANFLHGVSSGSIHGFLLAIKYCIFYNDFLQSSYDSEPQVTCDLIAYVIQLCKDTVNQMLLVMIGTAKTNAPSFAEIGRAIDELIPRPRSDRSIESAVNSYVASPEYQMLLTCCWHSIKNSCILISGLVSPILRLQMSRTFQLNFVQEIMQVLFSTLLRCRHRGVIEACSTVLNECCKELLEKRDGFEDIPLRILNEALNSLTSDAAISVTRRSAGLPLLIQSVVSSEHTLNNGKFLPLTINRLLEIIERPLPYSFDDKKDLPQAHAFHILKTLISDAGLSHKVVPWLDAIVPVCTSGFSSRLWCIRNGALQLFGVLLPRLCGQKKTKEDESGHNMISPSHLFARCPNLYSFLLRQVRVSMKTHLHMCSCPKLMPLLSLVVKLSPQEGNQIDKLFVKDFKPIILSLLGSRMWHIRRMAATALSSMLCAESSDLELTELLNSAINDSVIHNNKLNGVLLTLQKAFCSQQKFSTQNMQMVQSTLLCNLNFVLKSACCCNINKELYIETIGMFGRSTLAENMLFPMEDYCPEGLANSVVWKYHSLLQTMQSHDSSATVRFIEKMLLNPDTTEICLDFLYEKFNKSREQALPWEEILCYVQKHLDVCHVFNVLKCLKFVVAVCTYLDEKMELLNTSLASSLEEDMHILISKKCGLSVSAYCLTVASFCLKSLLRSSPSSSKEMLDFWITNFFIFCHPRKPEVLRFQAAEFVAHAGCSIVEFLSSEMAEDSQSASASLIILCDASLLLLQDEDEEIRNKVSVFVSDLPHVYKVKRLQSNVGIRVLCNLMLNLLSSEDSYLHYLWCKLTNIPCTSRILLASKVK